MGIAFVQKSTAAHTAGATSLASAFSTKPTAGNSIRVWAWGGNTPTAGQVTCTDNQSPANSYTQTYFNLQSGQGWVALFEVDNIVVNQSTFSVTISYGGGINDVIVVVAAEFSGPSATTDGVTHTGKTSTTPCAPGSITTTNAVDLICAGYCTGDTTVITSPGSPWTSLYKETNASLYQPGEAIYQITSATGTYNPSWTAGDNFTGSGWSTGQAAYKAAGGANPVAGSANLLCNSALIANSPPTQLLADSRLVANGQVALAGATNLLNNSLIQAGPTPTLVQHLATACSGTTSSPAATLSTGFVAPQVDIRLPNTCQAGNALILAITTRYISGGPTLNLPTDDGGNTWQAGGTAIDATNNQQVALFYANNIAAGTRHITVTFGNYQTVINNLGTALSVRCSEFCYASAIDGTSVAHVNASGTTQTSGSITTTTNNDLIWSAFWISNGVSLQSGSWTAGSGMTLLDADIVDSFVQGACQYGIQTTAGAINPSITTSSACVTVGVGIALKASWTGSPAPKNSIVRANWCNAINVQSASTMNFQFPCSGNLLIVVSSNHGLNQTATLNSPPITDSQSNTWAVADFAMSPNPDTVQSAISYAGNASSSSTLTGVIHTSNPLRHSTFCFIDVQGAATSPLGNHTNNSGNQTTCAPLTTCTLTPSQANSLCICTFSVYWGSFYGVNGVNSSNGDFQFQSPTMPQCNNVQNATQPNPLAEDQGWASVYNKTTNALTFTFDGTSNIIPSTSPQAGGAALWSSAAAEFKFASPTADTHHATLLPTTTATLTGYYGLDTFFTWVCPSGYSAKWACWGQAGSGATITTGTNVGGGGGRGGDCATALTPAVTAGNTYIFCLGASSYATEAIDDNITYVIAANGNSATAGSSTGASGTYGGTTTAGSGGTTHTGGNGATGTSSGGGGGGGAGGPTGNGSAGSVTAGGAAGTGSPSAGAGGAGKASGSTGNGTAGTAPGGGGGGGFFASSGTGSGGSGSTSQVIITMTSVGNPVSGSAQLLGNTMLLPGGGLFLAGAANLLDVALLGMASSVELAGNTVLTGEAQINPGSSASLSGQSSLQGVAYLNPSSSLSLSGLVQLLNDSRLSPSGGTKLAGLAALLSDSAFLSSNSSLILASAILQGAAQLLSGGGTLLGGQAAFLGDSRLNSVPQMSLAGGVLLGVDSKLQGAAGLFLNSIASLLANSTLDTTSVSLVFASAILAASSALDANPQLLLNSPTLLLVDSSLLAAGQMAYGASSALSAQAHLQGMAQAVYQASAQLTADTALFTSAVSGLKVSGHSKEFFANFLTGLSFTASIGKV